MRIKVIAPGSEVSIPGAEIQKAIVLETILEPGLTSYRVAYWMEGIRYVELLLESEVEADPVSWHRVGFYVPKPKE